MHRRALKYRRLMLQLLFPVLKQLPADAAARMVSRIGEIEYSLVPTLRHRFQETLNRAADHLDASWDANLVGRQRRMVQPRFCDVSHASSFCLDDLAASGATLLRMAPAMKRAVMGVPS